MGRAVAALVLLAAQGAAGDEVPGRFAAGRTVIGLEYATLDNQAAVRNKARVYAEMGLPGMKHYVEAVGHRCRRALRRRRHRRHARSQVAGASCRDRQ